MKPPNNIEPHAILLFDGVCNLCNSAVQFVIRRDKKDQFRFAALQSLAGQKFLEKYGISKIELNSFILIVDGKAYDRSSAALHVANKLGGLWKLIYGLIVVPKFIRDSIYNFIARKRYSWFGKKDECMIPTPQLRSKFLTD